MIERSTDLDEKLEALQDEVNLLKSEVKQTLVDLREFIMKDRTIFPQGPALQGTAPPRPPATDRGQEELALVSPPLQGFPMPPLTAVGRRMGPPLRDLQSESHSSGALDAVMLGNIIWWLGTVKRRGLSLQQLTPFLEAYEMSGHLTPSMAKLILRSMADLDDLEELPLNHGFSPHDYTDCLLQLHDIICTPGYVVDRLIPTPEVELPENDTQPASSEEDGTSAAKDQDTVA